MTLLWLLFRVRWRRALGPSLAVALLIGSIGGFALAAAASARRVESAYRTLLADIDAPDLAVYPSCVNAIDENFCLDVADSNGPALVVDRLLAMEVVEQARWFNDVLPYLVDSEGAPLLAAPDNPTGCFDRDRSVHMVAVGSGGASEQALPFRLEGELPVRGSADVVLARATAERIGIGIGDNVRLAGWCSDGDPIELASPIDLNVSGLSIGPLDIEPPGTGLRIEPAYVDPAVFETLVADEVGPALPNILVWVDPKASRDDIAEALAEFEIAFDFDERAMLIDEALATDARLLWLLAGIGALGGLLVLAPVIGRNLRETGNNTSTLAALGLQRPQIAHQAIAHCCALALIGAFTAAVLAVPIGTLMPDGLAAAIEPDHSLSIDWLVSIAGVGLLVVGVVAIGVYSAWRIAVGDRATANAASTRSAGRGEGIVSALRMRPAARTGVLAAVGAPAGPRRASPWPSLLSMVVVATAGVGSVTYLAGLRHLEDTPSVLGWNWDAMVSVDDPDNQSAIVARIDESAGVDQSTLGTGYPPWLLVSPGTEIPLIYPWTFATGPNEITPTMLHGRAPAGPDEVAIDSVFAEQAGLAIGDTVLLQRESLQSVIADELRVQAAGRGLDDFVTGDLDMSPVAASFEVTGIAVLPLERQAEVAQVTFTLDGFAEFVDPSDEEIMAVQAWIPKDLPPDVSDAVEEFLATVRIADRTDRLYLRFTDDKQAALAELVVVDETLEILAPTPDEVIGIIGLNLERNDRIPTALAMTVSVAFAMLVGYLLFAAVRARRFELAVMRALGMSTSGIRRSVAAQATATAVVALLVAVPAGIAIGRWAWLDYARDLEVLPVSITPWRTLAIVAVVAIAVANLAALTLGWSATNRSPGPDLRSE